MTTAPWHADNDLLAAYVAGGLDAISGASVEQHLAHCADCRLAIVRHTDLPALELGWQRVRDAVERPRLPWLIRSARRLGLSDPTSILLAGAASLRTAWLVSAFVALGFATAAAVLTDGGTLAPFLVVAPLMPVLGVASAYAPREDSLETLVATAPYGRTRLIMVRSLAVVVTSLPAALLLGLLLPGPLWIAVAWLGPALALLPVLLALSSFVGPRAAGAALAIGWCGVVSLSLHRLPPTWPVEPSQQLVYLALAIAAGLVLGVRAIRHQEMGALL
jgi:hypothetical protein